MKTHLYLCFYTAALLLSLAFTWLAIRLGTRLGWTDEPDVRKVHSKPVPRIGGVAVYLSVICVLLLAVAMLRGTDYMTHRALVKMPILVFGATMVFLLGLADDIRALPARLKLSVQLVAATFIYVGGIRIGSIGVADEAAIGLSWLAWLMTMLWVVGMTNAVNLIDGVDGLATSVSIIACGVMAVLAVTSDQAPVAVLMIAMLGALMGFLCFNVCPARIFLGDSGSLFLGFVIAGTSALCFVELRSFSALALAAVALGVPILDTLLSIVRRFVARRPIFAPDCGHFHHRLLQLGLGPRGVVAVVCGSTLVATCLSLWMLFTRGWTSLLLFGGIFALLFVLFHAVGVVRLRRVVTGLRSRHHWSHQAREEMSEFCNLQLRFDQARDAKAWWQAVCQAASQLDFAWISVDFTDGKGHTETHVWRCAEKPPASARVTIVRVPVRSLRDGHPVDVEVAVLTNGSIEGAARRASLFGRLMDEYGMPVFDSIDESVGATADVPSAIQGTQETRPIPTHGNLPRAPFGSDDVRQKLKGGPITATGTGPGSGGG